MFRFSPRTNNAHLVQWREWSESAFAEARQQNKLIAVFLCAFWCGYCQRLDESTLSHDDTIALLNAFFIPIRVEESQRPDVDLRYNQRGWPTIAFLTPAGEHLLSVNYTAPEPFINLLTRLIGSHQQDPDSLAASAAQPQAHVTGQTANREAEAPLGPAILGEIAGLLEGLADREHGGYGTGHKYLHAEANEFLLYLYETMGDQFYLDHVCFTLERMRERRIFDAKDGGFYRYSSRPDWQEPHPEKLLEDQAGLLQNHLHAYLLTQDPSLHQTAEGLIDYLDTTLLDANSGAFFGCQDYVRPEYQPSAGPAAGPPELLSVIDEYLYCDANARLASAYLGAWWVLGREGCRDRAVQILEILWEKLRLPDRGMCHYWDGNPQAPGLLMDSVITGTALLDAFACLGEEKYLERARELAGELIANHSHPSGGFSDLSEPGPGNLKYPVTLLTQNANTAHFLVRLADLSGDQTYRQQAHWALRKFPNSHRDHEAFAAGFGQSLARLLSLPLIVTLVGEPGDSGVLNLARAALSNLRHGNLVLGFRADSGMAKPVAEIRLGGSIVTISEASDMRPEVILGLGNQT